MVVIIKCKCCYCIMIHIKQRKSTYKSIKFIIQPFWLVLRLLNMIRYTMCVGLSYLWWMLVVIHEQKTII
jgi:hypothetical protein